MTREENKGKVVSIFIFPNVTRSRQNETHNRRRRCYRFSSSAFSRFAYCLLLFFFAQRGCMNGISWHLKKLRQPQKKITTTTVFGKVNSSSLPFTTSLIIFPTLGGSLKNKLSRSFCFADICDRDDDDSRTHILLN